MLRCAPRICSSLHGLLGRHGDPVAAAEAEVDLLGLLEDLTGSAQRLVVVSMAVAMIGGTNGRIQRVAASRYPVQGSARASRPQARPLRAGSWATRRRPRPSAPRQARRPAPRTPAPAPRSHPRRGGAAARGRSHAAPRSPCAHWPAPARPSSSRWRRAPRPASPRSRCRPPGPPAPAARPRPCADPLSSCARDSLSRSGKRNRAMKRPVSSARNTVAPGLSSV